VQISLSLLHWRFRDLCNDFILSNDLRRTRSQRLAILIFALEQECELFRILPNVSEIKKVDEESLEAK
jgi:hypothetical protein